MKIISFFLALILLTGCETKQVSEDVVAPVILTESTSSTEMYNLFLENDAYTLKKYEPKENSYLGIFLEENKDDFITDFEKQAKVTNSIYMYNLKLGEEFPLSWVLNCYSKYKTPFITIYPPDNLTETYDTEILEKMSKEFGALDIPIFVNFYPLTERLSTSPQTYKSFFKSAKTFFEINAPNVCFVWSIDYNFAYNAKMYYPGDEYTDWVGINIYEDILEDDKINIIFNELDIFYKTFQEIKPIAISNLAISHFSNKSFNYNIKNKLNELERFYSYIPSKYPRIKMINYINTDNLKEINIKNKQNYSISDNREILKSYRNLIENGKFSISIVLNEKNRNSSEKIKTPFLVYKKDNSFFLEKETIKSLGYENSIASLKEYYIDNKTLYSLDELINIFSLKKIVDDKNKNLVLK